MTKLFDARPFIIAEVGSNWRTLNDCIASIGQAKAVGADAVKFQLFTPDALYGPGHGNKDGDYAWPHLDPSWLPALKEKADACSIEFMCTAFSPELVEAVDPFVSVHKVASSDLSYPQLLAAVANTGKQTILSTGASGKGDIEYALTFFNQLQVVLLYCVASYPTKFVDLEVMKYLRDLGPLKSLVGFSDHTLGISMAVEACRQGAVVLEKHFTAFPDLDTPDRPHSLTPDEFKTMVDYIRGVRKPVIGPSPEERDMLLRHNRRLVATKDIFEGEHLEYGVNFGAYRSLVDDTKGLSPFAWTQVDGKTAVNALKRGEGIGPGDIAH